jgi:hypothetical protein
VFDTPVALARLLVVASLIEIPLLLRLKETKGMALAEMDQEH